MSTQSTLSDSCARPSSVPSGSTRRSRESTDVSVASAVAGVPPGHSASISSSRRTARGRASARYANTTRPCRPGNSSSRSPLETTNGPQSRTIVSTRSP